MVVNVLLIAHHFQLELAPADYRLRFNPFPTSSLGKKLQTGGHEVVRLVRRPPTSSDEIGWDPAAGQIDAAALEGFDAVIHLAGESIGAGRWTAARRRRIRESRVVSTALLCGALSELRRPPAVLVSASAIGYYGDVDGSVDESAPAGSRSVGSGLTMRSAPCTC